MDDLLVKHDRCRNGFGDRDETGLGEVCSLDACLDYGCSGLVCGDFSRCVYIHDVTVLTRPFDFLSFTGLFRIDGKRKLCRLTLLHHQFAV